MEFSKKNVLFIGIIFLLLTCISCSVNSKATKDSESAPVILSTYSGCAVSNTYYFQNINAGSDQILVFDENTKKVQKVFDFNNLTNPLEEWGDMKGLELKHFIGNQQNLFLFIRDFNAKQMGLYSCKLDGSNITKLADIPNSYSILNSALQDNVLFFTSILGTNLTDTGGSVIYRFDLDSNQLKPILNENNDYYHCPQIVNIKGSALQIREDVMTEPLTMGGSIPYATMNPAIAMWYSGYINHTDLLSYDIQKDEIIRNAENLYLYSSIL